MSEDLVKKQALLVGINEYQILPGLRYARQDAEAVADSLKKNYCFSENEIIVLTDVRPGLFKPTDKYIIQDHLIKLANQELDLFIFGFWGHGLFRNGHRYLCPINVKGDRAEQQGLLFDELQDLLANIHAKNTCMILDCCQTVHDRGESETLTISEQTTIENAARNIVMKRKEQIPEFHSNVAILNSCKEGQSAYEWDERQHGIFTAHLLDALNKRYESVAKIIEYINDNVERTAMELGKFQTPFYKLEGNISLPVSTKSIPDDAAQQKPQNENDDASVSEKSTPLVTGDVFISYRHCNYNLVEPVEAELKKRGLSYFIDRDGINYGMEYSRVLIKAVKACNVLIFVWTQDADISPDILREVTMAMEFGKIVIPYKIGTFNVKEHESLFYYLSPLSRYEVVQQTPETVKELVNRVELALKGNLPSTVFLPEEPKGGSIQIAKIDDINITITPRIIEQPLPSVQYKEITLPPISDELLNIPAENRGLTEAIEQLNALTHESLAQANEALKQTQNQFDFWKERKEQLWKDMPQATRQMLENVISSNPNCSLKDIPTNNMTEDQYFVFLEQFQCGKNYEQAKRELERVKKERITKCNEAIEHCKQQIKNNEVRYQECVKEFYDKAIMTILAVMPGYNDVNAVFPDSQFLEPLRHLKDYKLGWHPAEIHNRAKELWEKQRPCVEKTEKARLLIEQENEEKRRKQAELNKRKYLQWGIIAVNIVLLVTLLYFYPKIFLSCLGIIALIILVHVLWFIDPKFTFWAGLGGLICLLIKIFSCYPALFITCACIIAGLLILWGLCIPIFENPTDNNSENDSTEQLTDSGDQPMDNQCKPIQKTDKPSAAKHIKRKSKLEENKRISSISVLFNAIHVAGERKTISVKGVNFTFRWCPPGSFTMGSPVTEKERNNDENQYVVILSKGFWIMETEVTQKQWKAVMGNNPSGFKGDDLPVEQVSWHDCQKFCNQCAELGLPLQLPTEAQWEYACRAGSKTAFFWGNALKGDKANCDGNYPYGTKVKGVFVNETTPVGCYSPNAWGLYDMHGNVWEWCREDANYSSEDKNNASNARSTKVARGGSWVDNAKDCRSACRFLYDPNTHQNLLGFRCVVISQNSDV